MIKTLNYISTDEFVEVENEYYFGQLWDGKGDGKQLLEDGCIAMYDEEIEDFSIVGFEIIENDENIMRTWVKVVDVY